MNATRTACKVIGSLPGAGDPTPAGTQVPSQAPQRTLRRVLPWVLSPAGRWALRLGILLAVGTTAWQVTTVVADLRLLLQALRTPALSHTLVYGAPALLAGWLLLSVWRSTTPEGQS